MRSLCLSLNVNNAAVGCDWKRLISYLLTWTLLSPLVQVVRYCNMPGFSDELIRSYFEDCRIELPGKMLNTHRFPELIGDITDLSSKERSKILLRLSQKVRSQKSVFSLFSLPLNMTEEIAQCFQYYAGLVTDQRMIYILDSMDSIHHAFAPLSVARLVGLNLATRNFFQVSGEESFISALKMLVSAGLEIGTSTLTVESTERCISESVVIAHEGADLDGIVDLVVSTTWSPFIGEYPVTVIVVQESLREQLLQALRIKLELHAKKQLGDQYQCRSTAEEVEKNVKDAISAGAKVEIFTVESALWSPSIIHEYYPPSRERIAPLLSLLTYRSPSEAVKLVNHLGIPLASIWGNDANLSLTIAEMLDVDTVWINRHGITHYAVPILGQGGLQSFITLNNDSNVKKLKDLTHLVEKEELSEFTKLILRWSAPVLSVAANIPSNLNVLSRFRKPRGLIHIHWKKNDLTKLMQVLIPALSCGNKIVLQCSEEIEDILKKSLGQSIAFTSDIDSCKAQILWYDDDSAQGECFEKWRISSNPSDQEILSQCIQYKHIWLPGSSSL